MWTQWYAPKRWPVWARSTSPLLSCLRTTMTVENHWRQLKAFAHRPRLDHAIHVICTAMVPAYMAIAAKLEDAYQLGRARGLTPYEVVFGNKRQKPWSAEGLTARCGPLALQLRRSRDGPSPYLQTPGTSCSETSSALLYGGCRRRTDPLDRHPRLRTEGSNPGRSTSPEDGSIIDGDNHEGIGGIAMLTKAARDENGVGGCADVLQGAAKGCSRGRDWTGMLMLVLS